MTNELKRVGLVFKNDGSVDFVKSLQNINTELSKNYTEFKKVQAQWDESTKKTEKLKYQIENLSNAYQLQEDKVKILKEQLEDMESAENKNATAINKKRAELDKAELKLISYQKKIEELSNQLKISGKNIIEFGDKIEKTGSKIVKAGKTLSTFSGATTLALGLSAKAGIDFEDAFTGVEKTVNATDEQLEKIKNQIRDLAKEMPATTTEISAVAESAGQLGIKTEDIMSFTKVMLDLGNSTNISAEEAASSLAKFANVTKMSADKYSNLGATIVELGNNFATTEADIVDMSTKLAATGELAGLSQADILALATAMSSVGIEAEAGGSAMSKLLKNIQIATETGNDSLKQFAKVAGMTSEEFKKAFEKDAVKALSAFIAGLNDTKRNGKSAISILNDMGLTEVRLSNTILSLSNASEVMNDAIDTANKGWEDNTALTNEANKRYGTLKSKIVMTLNKIKDMAITLGNKLMPSISKIVEQIGKWIDKFSKLNDEQVDTIVKIGLLISAIGPVITILGKVVQGVGGAVKAIGTFKTALEVAKGLTVPTSESIKLLSNVFNMLKNPISLVVGIIGTLLTVSAQYMISNEKQKASLNGLRDEVEKQKKSWKELANSRQELLAQNMPEIELNQKLVEELKNITNENGRVKAGYETRAQIILTTLNKALGTEYKMNGNIISQYDQLKVKIDELIAKKKAEALLNAYQQEYATAMKEQTKATETLVGLRKQLADAQLKMATGNEKERMEAQLLYSSISEKIREQTDLVGSYGKTIIDYENLQKASAEGSKSAIDQAVKDINTSYTKLNDQTKKTLSEQIKDQTEYTKSLKECLIEAKTNNDKYQTQILDTQLSSSKKQLDNLINSLVEQTSTIEELTPDQIEAWKTVAHTSLTEYSAALSKIPEKTKQNIEEATNVVALDVGLSNATGEEAKIATINFGNNLNLKSETQQEISKSEETLMKDTSIQEEAGNLAERAEKAVEQNDSETWGSHMVEGLGNGIRKKSNSSWFTGILTGTAGMIASFLHFSRPDRGPLREYEKWMPDMVEGLGKTLEKSSPVLTKQVEKMSGDISEELQSINTIQTKNSRNQDFTTKQKLEIDYNQMANAITRSLTNCKFSIDEEGFARIIKDELYKVV